MSMRAPLFRAQSNRSTAVTVAAKSATLRPKHHILTGLFIFLSVRHRLHSFLLSADVGYQSPLDVGDYFPPAVCVPYVLPEVRLGHLFHHRAEPSLRPPVLLRREFPTGPWKPDVVP